MSYLRLRTAGSPTRRAVAALALVVVMLAGASTALAYWRTSGSGSGSAATATTLAITLTPGTPTAGLYPGGQADVAVVVDNPNALSIHVGSLALSTGQGTAGYDVDWAHAGCPTSALSFTTQTNGGAGWSVPAKVGSTDGALSIDLANAVSMASTAANACQGASFTVYLTAGA